MDIKLIPVEKGSKFTFPALPEKVQGKYAAKYQSFDIISLGTVKVPKGTDVSEFSWDGVFFGASKKNEAIVKTNAWKSPNECVKILNDYMLNETVLTLIVSETWIKQYRNIKNTKKAAENHHLNYISYFRACNLYIFMV